MLDYSMLDQVIPLRVADTEVCPVAVCDTPVDVMAALVPVAYEDPMAMLEAALGSAH